jgi:hypothetical protein
MSTYKLFMHKLIPLSPYKQYLDYQHINILFVYCPVSIKNMTIHHHAVEFIISTQSYCDLYGSTTTPPTWEVTYSDGLHKQVYTFHKKK